MQPNQRAELETLKKAVLDGMASSLDEGGSGYSKADILRCRKLLDGFVAGMDKLGAPAAEDAILAEVETIVLALNKLNDECGHALIETTQRQDLCALILTAARQAGLAGEEDVTASWREW